MANSDLIERELVEMNERIGVEEQSGTNGHLYFNRCLAGELVFRRATGKVVGKEDFLKGLNAPSPFMERHAEDIVINQVGDRALVTLIVVTKRQDGLVQRFRNIRLFSQKSDQWILELWYNYEITGL